MKTLLDTNIVIHREASTVIKEEIGILFHWLDRLHYVKCIHPLTIAEIHKHHDPKVVATFDIKLKNYYELKTEAPETPEILQLRQIDKDQNDSNDTSLVKEVFAKRVDYRNAIRKVFISRSDRKDMAAGDIIVFYRTKHGGPAHYTAVVTTIGIIESVISPISSFEELVRFCRKRSVFTQEELKKFWDYWPNLKPFVVNFLFVHSLPQRPNLAQLKQENIISGAPRGFEEISDAAFSKLIEISNANKRLIVD